MKPHRPKASRFIRSVQTARIGLSLRQTWKPFRMRHARAHAMFKRERRYNEWLVNWLVRDARHRVRLRIASPDRS